MIGALIFSENSPMRLEALLRSASINASGIFGSLSVIYSATSASSKKGYEIVSKEFPCVGWVEMSNMKADVLSAIENSGASSTCFLSDCDVFFSNVFGMHDEIEKTLEDQSVICFSLRLGENTTKCYLMAIDNRLYGQHTVGENSIKFDWKKHYLDFGNPFSINGHVYRSQEILKMLRKLTFDSPSDMDDAMQLFQEYPKEMMASFKKSAVVTLPRLEIMSMVKNRKERPTAQSDSELTEAFLSGSRIDLGAMDFSSVNACYLEAELKLK
jgi:hypothetical protein